MRAGSCSVAVTALLVVPLCAAGQGTPDIVLGDPTPTTAINRCDALPPYRYEFDRMYRTTLGLDEEGVRARSRQLQDSLRMELQYRPQDIDLQYLLAGVIAIEAEIPGGLSQVRSSKVLHAQTEVLLAMNPDHPGALFFLGRLHSAVLGMGRIKRFIATTFLGASQFAGADWDEAQRLLESAVIGDPCASDHHFELARLYLSRGDTAMARNRLERLLAMKLAMARDLVVAERARALLKELDEAR